MGLRRATHVAWRRVGDETVLIHLKTKKIYVLNPSAGFFWHSLDGARGSREMLEGLRFELPDDAGRHLDGFLDKLETAGLVEAGPSPSQESGDRGSEYPLPGFVAPELVWQEQLRNFGQSCARDPGEMPTCDAAPTF